MKTIQLLIISLASLSFSGLVACSAPGSLSKSEQAKEVKTLIESKKYTINVDRMIPMNGRSRHLTSSYSVAIQGDTLKSYLPYFGQAYSVPYGGGKGLIFEEKITVYTLSFDAKGTANISIETRTSEDQFIYNIKVFNNGSSSIQVTSNNRQPISYYGQLELRIN